MSNQVEPKDTTPSVALLVIPATILPGLVTGWPADVLVVGTAECITKAGELAFYCVSPLWKGLPWPKDGTPRQLNVKRITGQHTAGWVFELEPLKSGLVGLGGNAINSGGAARH